MFSRFFSILKIYSPIIAIIIFPEVIWWSGVIFITRGKVEEAFYFSINRTDLLPHHVNEPLLFFIWCSIYFTTIAVNSVALLYSFYVIYKSSGRFRELLAFFIFGILFTIPFFCIPDFAQDFAYLENVICPRPEDHFYRFHAQWCIIKYSYSDGFYRKVLQELLMLQFLSIFNLCYFLIAACSTLTPPSRCQIWSAGLLFYRAACARNLLYIGSLFLTMAIVSEISLDIWLGSLIKEGNIFGKYRSQSIGVIIYEGFWYTLTLFSIFIPLDRFFMQYSCKLAEIVNPFSTQKYWAEWAQEQGFIIFGKGSMYRLLSVFSPVLTSAASALVEAIIKSII